MERTPLKTLRERMADCGFESNEDYEYQVQCLLQGPFSGIRTLNIQGDSGRRKTAFATALAQALGYPHVIYHDYSERKPPPPEVHLPPSKDPQGREEAPIHILDRRMSEACAQSEGEGTIVILDQLQEADFREHIRIYRFLLSGKWIFREAIQYANRKYLLVFLISEKPLYHSLQKHSFRIWVPAVSSRRITYRPEDFGLEERAIPMMQRLDQLFEMLAMSPTHSEYERLLFDIHQSVRTAEELRHSIFGWVEGVDRQDLFSERLREPLEAAIDAILLYLGGVEIKL